MKCFYLAAVFCSIWQQKTVTMGKVTNESLPATLTNNTIIYFFVEKKWVKNEQRIVTSWWSIKRKKLATAKNNIESLKYYIIVCSTWICNFFLSFTSTHPYSTSLGKNKFSQYIVPIYSLCIRRISYVYGRYVHHYCFDIKTSLVQS